jgi:hypothetical protein
MSRAISKTSLREASFFVELYRTEKAKRVSRIDTTEHRHDWWAELTRPIENGYRVIAPGWES